MASAGAASYRDRTSEFQSLSETLKKIGGISSPSQSQRYNGPATSQPPLGTSYGSEFNKKASRIGLGIHETSQKIARLSKLARRSSIFDDPMKEIQELTALIKDDITTLNIAVSDLQTLQNMEIADGNYSDDKVVHSTAVCDDLKNRLMGATKQFQDVLTTRTEIIIKWSSGCQPTETKVSCGYYTFSSHGGFHVTAGGSTATELFTKSSSCSSKCGVNNYRA